MKVRTTFFIIKKGCERARRGREEYELYRKFFKYLNELSTLRKDGKCKFEDVRERLNAFKEQRGKKYFLAS